MKFNKRQYRALHELFLEKSLGQGCARTVFGCKVNPHVVYKVAKDNGTTIAQNLTEFKVWDCVEGTAQEKFFAPVYDISSCGLVLAMARTQPLTPDTEIPELLPKYITDLKRDAFGLYEGRVVLHDYGLLSLYSLLRGTRKVKVP